MESPNKTAVGSLRPALPAGPGPVCGAASASFSLNRCPVVLMKLRTHTTPTAMPTTPRRPIPAPLPVDMSHWFVLTVPMMQTTLGSCRKTLLNLHTKRTS